jgi:multiple sugar transport system substrate-binding protein
MKKFLVILLVVLMSITLVFIGCKTTTQTSAAAETTAAAEGETTAAAAETTSAAAGEKKIVKFMWAEYDGIQLEYTKELEKAFEAANPDIDLQIISTSWNDYEARLDTFVAGGEAPDIAVIGTRWLLKYMDLGLVEPIEKWISKPVLDDIIPATIEGKIGGELKALPVAAGPRIMFYRSDIVPEAPKTFEEMKEIAKKVTKPPEMYGVGMIGKSPYVELTEFVYYFYGAGGNFFEVKDDGTLGKCTVNSEEGVKALTFMKSLVKEKLVQPTVLADTRDEVQQIFVSGKLAFHLSGGFVESLLVAAKVPFKYNSALMPSFEGAKDPRTVVITDSIMMFNTSKVKAEAGRVLDFFYQPEWRIPFDKQTGFPPLTNSSAKDEYFQKPTYKVMVEAMGKSKGWPLMIEWPRANDIIWEAIGKVFLNDADPKAALDEAAGKIDTERGIK